MSCGHKFCAHCWTNQLSGAVNGKVALKSSVLMLGCPKDGCQLIVGEYAFRRFLGNSPTYKRDFQKYRRMQLLSFMQDNEDVSRCPHASCNNIVAL